MPDDKHANKKRTSIDKTHLRKIYRERVYHILLSFFLLIALLQLLCGTGMNITKFITLNKQIHELRQLNREADMKNIQLKEQFRIYSSYSGIEELARNNLKMVGKDEVLVLIKKH
jgi:cell division protein FtsB